MLMTFARTEPNVITGGFGTEFTTLVITATDTLEDVMRKTTECIGHGGDSDCSSPVKWTMETIGNHIRDIDAFVIFTANENGYVYQRLWCMSVSLFDESCMPSQTYGYYVSADAPV